jgi:phytoene dehydrogenase-like protein
MPLLMLGLLLAQLAEGQLAAVERGSLDFALAVARRYQGLGGQIVYGAEVQEILVESGRAIGVRLADGSEQRAGRVISAADGHSTLYQMLGGRYGRAELHRRYRAWPTFAPICLVSYGVADPYTDWPAESLIRLQTPFAVGDQQVKQLSCSILRGPAFAPTGKAVIKVYLETGFEHWNDLRQVDRARYDAAKEQLAVRVLERLETHLPGIQTAVEMTDVATPSTFWRYTRNRRGAYEGWLMTPETWTHPMPKTLPGLEGFYMAGQWVEPGGGVPTVLLSGRQVVQLICHHDKVAFSPTPGPRASLLF